MTSVHKLWIACLGLVWLAGCGEVDKPSPAAPSPPPTVPQPPLPAAPPEGTAQPTRPSPPSTPSVAATPATTLKATELKDRPFLDARTLQMLAPKTAVGILERQGGWLRVEVRGQSGWVRLLDVSVRETAGGAGTAEEVKAIAGLATGRAGTGNIVATSGIRGLSAEQLRAAAANPAELERLERYGIGRDEAAAYARRHKLEARQVPYLPAPGGE